MSQEIKVPPMGESITEATVADWHFSEGQSFNSGDILVELETDKVTMEVPAPAAGKLTSIKKQSGETVQLDEVLAIIEEGAGADAGSSGSDSKSSDSSGSEAKSSESGGGSQSGQSSSGSSQSESSGRQNDTVPPGARRLAAEEGVDTSSVQGTGKGGQVRKEDVVNHLEKGGSGSSSRGESAPSKPATSAEAIKPSRQKTGEREKVESMSRLRQKIAERLVSAQQTAAILTTFNEVDMTRVMDIRNQYKDLYAKKYGIKLGFMSFFVKAAVEALKAYPAINAEIRGTDIVHKNYYDVGVAVGGPRGLVVPIVRDADLLTFAEIEMEIARLAGRVQEGSISLDEMTGGTFTISNGGIYGSMLSTPILNPPQSGILGMHNITKRAMVVDDEIVIRPMMYLALSYDHRIVDGKEAVSFLVKIKECIENPERILLEI
ncbi:MAG TPA: dihydrolipoamide succinyltransferase [Leptospiraceae bacterium]|mgnify:CR=1 FL=1|nr:dihydrolipoyllysine-residue succinyltransferase [Spirochaetaceae bacterium]HBS03621.1 dihydrolipoamide succinyltransferase [Leptospiraceae bacterium]|tara:strand:+ start:29599 stop:30900 length:1302 start_codon:yes stop_codon:yes gene_type:complete